MRLLTKLYGYQKAGVRLIDRFGGRALLADEMGLGKSVQALTYFLSARIDYPKRPMVVVCPANLRFNWQNEFKVHLGVTACVLEGRKGGDAPADAPAYVVGYETVGKLSDPTSWAYFLKRRKPFLITVDECHRIKSRAAKQTKNVVSLGKGIPKRIAVSGTPLVNRPAELWPSLHLVRPDLYPSFRAFADKHCRPERKPWGWEFKGAENLDELHTDLLMTMMVRRLKADVLDELPPKVRHVIPLALTGRKEYEAAYRDFLKWMRQNYRHKLSGAQRAVMLTKTGYLIRLAAELKLPAVLTWVQDWLADNAPGKLILFGRHTKILDACFARFNKQAVLVNGPVPMGKRRERIEAFQTNPKCRLFVGQIDAAGVGWNGTAASAVAFAEIDWRPGAMRQAEDRGHRIGQHRSLDCFYLTAHGTIEEKLCETIQHKQGVLDQVLDGGMVADELSVFDDLMNSIKETK